MFDFRITARALAAMLLIVLWCATAYGQHEWQEAPVRDVREIERIIGPVRDEAPSRDLNITWVWGVDKNHERGAHEYAWVMDRFVNTLLPQVPRVAAKQAMYFPSDEQWSTADLIVFYLQSPRPWTAEHYARLDAFQKRGGGVIVLHLALLEGTGAEWAKRIGLAYSTERTGTGLTEWGVLPTPVSLTGAGSRSLIFKGFPDRIDLVDEHYWNLRGEVDQVTTYVTSPGGPALGSTRAPRPEELDGRAWPVAWTREVGRGRVFATVLGHNYFTFNDPYFRIILLRAIAWTLNESFEPFKPLVLRNTER